MSFFPKNSPKEHEMKSKKRLIFIRQRAKNNAQTTPLCAKKIVF